MSDTDGKKPLGLRGATPGQVKQSFSHGRTKSVVVETKRKRVIVPKPGAAPGAGSIDTAAAPTKHLGDPAKRPGGISDAEMERRLKAVQAAKAREVEDAATRDREEREREEDRQRRREEIEAKEREEREHEEFMRRKADEEERAKAEAEAATRKAEEPTAAAPAAPPQPAASQVGERPGGARPSAQPPRKSDREREADRDSRGKS